MRTTVFDVAREAGVSVATVDRVLNNRAGVRERTRSLVFESARRLGYLPDIANGAASAPVRLDFVLPAGGNPFMANLKEEIEAQARARSGVEARVAAIEAFNPESLAEALLAFRGGSDGVGVVALDHPAVREAIRALTASGVPVATMVSDILYVPRVAYVGIDNRAAGRLAGYLMRRFVGERPAEAALFAGSLSYRGHEEREMGFRHLLADEAPNLRIVELREMRDDAERAYAEASSLLDAYPDLAAIYNIGAGNSGIARALKERGRERAVTFIAHEISQENRGLLLDGTLDAVIDQNPRVEARETLSILENAARGLDYKPHPPRLHAIFKENIPET